MSPTLIAIMVIAGAGMIFGLSKHKSGVLWGKPVATVCAVIALVCALVQMAKNAGSGNMNKLLAVQNAYSKVSTLKLGKHLAEKHAGAKAVIVIPKGFDTPPAGDSSKKHSATVEGLLEGLGSAVTVVATLTLEPPPAPAAPAGAPGAPGAPGAAGAPLSMMDGLGDQWFTPELLDAALKKQDGNYDMIISFMGLPREAGKLQIWTQTPMPKVVIAAGAIQEFRKAIEAKAIVAALINNPLFGPSLEDGMPPPDLEAAFKQRFLLITPDTVAQIAKEHTNIFFDATPQPAK